jgi:tetratricopeptide (TPR) repeat protein
MKEVFMGFVLSEMVGKNLNSIRVKQKMSQSNTAMGICTQAMLSKIERGICSPSIEILYPLCKRLNIDISLLIKDSLSERADYVNEVYFQLRKFVNTRNYYEVMKIVTFEKKTPLAKLPSFKKLLLWHEAIYIFYIKKNNELCFQVINDALSIDRFQDKYSSVDLEILITKAIFQVDNKQYQSAIETFKKVEKNIKEFPVEVDSNIMIKFNYNFCRALRLSGRIEESIRYARKTIKKCIESQSMYLLDDVYTQLGISQKEVLQWEASQSSFERAYQIYKLKGNHDMMTLVLNKLDNIKE